MMNLGSLLPNSFASTQASILNTQFKKSEQSSAPFANPTAAPFSNSAFVRISQGAQTMLATEHAPSASGVLDFSNIAPKQMLNTINSLIKNGQMSLDESSSLIVMLPISPLSKAVSGLDDNEIANKPINFFTGLQQMITFNESIHNDNAVIYAKKALAALERLQGKNFTI